MPVAENAPSATRRRPSWFDKPPAFELDFLTEPPLALSDLLERAEELSPGQTFAVRLGCEPALLCSVLARRGFNHWAGPDGDGAWTAHFLRVTW
ncbi:MAG: DUF2249 domain-containing protein [Elusimicrobia bacterium]|nr:DUF2249 domain-containing protein [Elusimicrobiota bacterium]